MRKLAHVFELGFDVVAVSSLSLLASLLLTAFFSLPSYSFLQSCQLGEEVRASTTEQAPRAGDGGVCGPDGA